MDVSVIIPTYNRAQKIQRVLDALDEQVCPGFQYTVRVMDDGSEDDTRQVLAAYQPSNYKLYWDSQENSGPGGARNKLLEAVETPLVVIIGDDIIPDPHFLKAHRHAHIAADDPKLAVLGFTAWYEQAPITTVMAHIDGVGAQQFSYFYLKDGEYYDFRHFYTSNISIRTDFIRLLGTVFRDDFVGYGFEDTEVGLRLEKQGMRILYRKEALAYHDHFYSVRGFCKRQLKVGIAARTFVALHPEVGRILGFDRLHLLKRRAILPWRILSNKRFSVRIGSLEALEERVLRLLSAYENLSNPHLDAMYIALFNYFYYKGLAAYSSPWMNRQLNSNLMREMLLPAVSQFVRALMRESFPVASEECEAILPLFNCRAERWLVSE